MELYFVKTKEKKNIRYKGQVGELLTILKINQETVIVTKESTVLTPDSKISNKDKLTLIPVFSGG